MEQEIRSYEAQNKTGNEVLDTILTSKSLYCQQHGITLTCVADGAALDFMDTMDLCSLFGNALDNAIESVEKLPDSEQRLIHLVVARQKSFCGSGSKTPTRVLSKRTATCQKLPSPTPATTATV